MKAILVRQFGGPEVLKLEELADPAPGPGELTVRVKAVGVNPVDTYIRSGNYGTAYQVPYTPGSDAAGLVVGERPIPRTPSRLIGAPSTTSGSR